MLRQWGILQYNLVSSPGLIMWIDHGQMEIVSLKNECTCFQLKINTQLRQLTQFLHMLLLMQFSACTRIAKSKHVINSTMILFAIYACTICAIFLHNWTQCIDSFSLLLQRYIRKGIDAKNLSIFSFFFVTKRTQLNAVHAW